jgi:cysteinyl-tRNA synthetase
VSAEALVLYDTRTRAKRAFAPLEPGRVRIYSCGPTVYAPQHLGNMRSQLLADLLKRTLLFEGYAVLHVINITDVGHLTGDSDAGEDKLEQAAARSGRSAGEVAAQYTAQWLRDRERLGCLAPEVLCKATDHIAEQIALVERLEAKGVSYRIADGIYFDTAKFPRYGEFARLYLAGQAGGARIGDVPGKRQPADFALWKFAPPGVKRQQEWDSPWGRGFPGWHVECSAMAERYLGHPFDIHTGGVDHVAVHHSNEVAQSECAWDVHPWVGFWLHNEFLDLRGEKMAKSTGNVAVLDDLIARGLPPLAFRYLFLQAHYRQQQTYTDEAMDAAATGYDRLLAACRELREAEGEGEATGGDELRRRFRSAIRDDLNAPRALAVVWEATRAPGLSAAARWAVLREADAVLGLDLAHGVPAASRSESDPRIDALVAERNAARERRDFASADRIRRELAAEGISIEDTPGGARWRRT